MSTAGAAASLRAIERELAVVRLGGSSAIANVLPEMRAVADLESLLLFTPAETLTGLEMKRFDSDGLADPVGLRERFTALWSATPRRYAWYDPITPEPEQRNRVLEAHDLMRPGELEQSSVYARVLLPLRLHQHRQPRVLLCEGSSLLAWFGSFHGGAVSARHLGLLRCFARPLRRRLAIERRLEAAVREAALSAAMEELGAPAFVLVGKRIAIANASGQQLLRTRRDEVREVVQGRGVGVQRIAIEEAGCPHATLAILGAGSRDAQIVACVARVAADRQLTSRQTQVLERVVRGETSVTIAAELGITARTVEMHLSSLFRRFEVEGRSSLVAAVLRASLTAPRAYI